MDSQKGEGGGGRWGESLINICNEWLFKIYNTLTFFFFLGMLFHLVMELHMVITSSYSLLINITLSSKYTVF